jgi:hypothetical protein
VGSTRRGRESEGRAEPRWHSHNSDCCGQISIENKTIYLEIPLPKYRIEYVCMVSRYQSSPYFTNRTQLSQHIIFLQALHSVSHSHFHEPGDKTVNNLFRLTTFSTSHNSICPFQVLDNIPIALYCQSRSCGCDE